jgi:probable HAF family extracellular repeat protein
MSPISLRGALLAGCLSLVCGTALAAGYTVTGITIPNATYVYPLSINAAGTAVGYYGTKKGNPQGFLYANGAATTLQYPKALQTYALGINNAGTVVGQYMDANHFFHGFTYTSKGFTDVSVPNASGTYLDAINQLGVAAGATVSPSGTSTAFTYAGGKFTTIPTTAGQNPIPVAINNAGAVAGWYYSSNTRGESSWYYSKGTTVTLPNPGLVFYTQVFGMNQAGQVVGQAASTNGDQHGFMYTRSHYNRKACPAKTLCYFGGINDNGLIVGIDFTAPTVSTAFTIDAKTNVYTTLPALNGDTNYGATAVNNAGVIVGETSTAAFIATPTP